MKAWGKSSVSKPIPETKSSDVEDFLRYGGKQNCFPNTNLFIGMEFGIGGASEDFGFGVYHIKGDKHVLIGAGMTLSAALAEARKRINCAHELNKHDRCVYCHLSKDLI